MGTPYRTFPASRQRLPAMTTRMTAPPSTLTPAAWPATRRAHPRPSTPLVSSYLQYEVLFAGVAADLEADIIRQLGGRRVLGPGVHHLAVLADAVVAALPVGQRGERSGHVRSDQVIITWLF